MIFGPKEPTDSYHFSSSSWRLPSSICRSRWTSTTITFGSGKSHHAGSRPPSPSPQSDTHYWLKRAGHLGYICCRQFDAAGGHGAGQRRHRCRRPNENCPDIHIYKDRVRLRRSNHACGGEKERSLSCRERVPRLGFGTRSALQPWWHRSGAHDVWRSDYFGCNHVSNRSESRHHHARCDNYGLLYCRDRHDRGRGRRNQRGVSRRSTTAAVHGPGHREPDRYGQELPSASAPTSTPTAITATCSRSTEPPDPRSA